MDFEELIKDARNAVREIAPADVANDIDNYVVVDVREPEEILHGYLKRAINVPRGILERSVVDDSRLANPERPTLVYSGTGIRSLLACVTLQQLGFTNVCSLTGGIRRWSDEDLPVY